VASAVAVASLVLAGHHSVLAAATVHGARHGPVLGYLPLASAGIHQPRIDAALEHVANALGHDAYAAAQQRGAAMTYDGIIAYTVDQLAQIADS
jgi:hypothetical protein